MTTAICWLRNDLRLDDNPVLAAAAAAHERVVVFYYLDHRQLRELPELGFRKTGPHRLAFLLAALVDLRNNLRELGGAAGAELIFRQGDDPAASLRELVDRTAAAAVYVQAEIASEETTAEAAVAAALPGGCPLSRVWGKTLYHADDLPFPADECPEPFRGFRRVVEREVAVRPPTEPLPELPGVPGLDPGRLPTVEELGYDEEPAPAYPGGESAALARLHHYLDGSHLVKTYRATRNRSLGADYSTKFSAYLATGCLSPRRVHAEIHRYQRQHGNRAGNSVLFEMRWRDFFIFLARKHGNRIFRPGGYRGRKHDWNHDRELFDNWRHGRTGLPFVDAHLRELAATGFMSNRGRVNCASFLTRDYRTDWRWGAAWFENRLLDYEVSANWLNWHTQALEIYYTSAPWQGLKYDRDGRYVKTWLPELAELPAPLVHAPWKMAEEGMLDELDFDLDRDYYRPRVTNSKWDWAWNRLRTGDASSPRAKRATKGRK